MDKNKIAVQIFNTLANVYQDKFMDVSLYGDTFDFFCDRIPNQNAEILELACGPGNITKYLLNRRPDFKIVATDLSQNMIELAKTNNPSADFQIMDCRKISQLESKYNGMVCGFCLPYLSKEEAQKLISDASQLLLNGGLLYLSTMEDDYKKSGIQKASSGDELFMHFYEANFLIQHLTKNHFEILATYRKLTTATNGTNTTDLILIAKKIIS